VFGGTAVVGALTYFAVTAALGSPELLALKSAIMRRMRA